MKTNYPQLLINHNNIEFIRKTIEFYLPEEIDHLAYY